MACAPLCRVRPAQISRQSVSTGCLMLHAGRLTRLLCLSKRALKCGRSPTPMENERSPKSSDAARIRKWASYSGTPVSGPALPLLWAAHTQGARDQQSTALGTSTGTLSELNETALAGFIALELCRRQGVSLRFTPTDFSKYKAASEEVRPASARASRSGSPWDHNCRCWCWSEHACWLMASAECHKSVSFRTRNRSCDPKLLREACRPSTHRQEACMCACACACACA